MLLLVASVGVATAQEYANEITPFGGYRFGGSIDVEDSDDSWDWEEAASFGLIWNRAYRGNTEWEVFFSQQSTDADFSDVTITEPTIDVETTTLQIGGTYLWEGQKAHTYLAATIGGTHIKADGRESESDTFWSGSVGLGIKIAPTARVGLRLEARANAVLTRNSTDLFCRTGPDLNVCAIRTEGDLFSQVETFAGIVFRF